MNKDNFITLTGAPGTGKSTLLRLLREMGYTCVAEPARQIIAQQRAIQGPGVSDKDPALFVELMLSCAIFRYQELQHVADTVIFDRGVADIIAYAALYDLPFAHGWEAARLHRNNSRVFFAPNWKDIYTTDEERTMSFDASASMGDKLRSIYQTLGYKVIDLPLSDPHDRAQFIVDNIS